MQCLCSEHRLHKLLLEPLTDRLRYKLLNARLVFVLPAPMRLHVSEYPEVGIGLDRVALFDVLGGAVFDITGFPRTIRALDPVDLGRIKSRNDLLSGIPAPN